MTDTQGGWREKLGRKVRRGTPDEVRTLRRRVSDLEAEMQESRQLNRRLAELMDVVEELLVPLSQQDEARVRAYLDSHRHVL